jgi:broad specificity phosphatase PhoE
MDGRSLGDMRWLEVRRHSLTKKGPARGHGSHLSADGVALARSVGADLGPFARVVTGVLPRLCETAIAMGFAVDECVDWPSGYVPGEVEHHDQWRWSQPYVRYAELVGRASGLADVAAAHRRVWTSAVQAVAEGEAALVISSGGAIEPTLVACFPDGDHASWGRPMAHCEGARLGFDQGGFVSVELARRDADA